MNIIANPWILGYQANNRRDLRALIARDWAGTQDQARRLCGVAAAHSPHFDVFYAPAMEAHEYGQMGLRVSSAAGSIHTVLPDSLANALCQDGMHGHAHHIGRFSTLQSVRSVLGLPLH